MALEVSSGLERKRIRPGGIVPIRHVQIQGEDTRIRRLDMAEQCISWRAVGTTLRGEQFHDHRPRGPKCRARRQAEQDHDSKNAQVHDPLNQL